MTAGIQGTTDSFGGFPAATFPPSASRIFLDFPPVSLRSMQSHLTEIYPSDNSFIESVFP
jgi:hypothetical protein